jgi:Flp pilus assembly protein TadG
MNFRMKKSFEAFGLRWSRTKERGATAVVIALCLTLLMAAAAVSFDTANLALQRQTLQNITDAAAQAGASYLPDTVLAKQAANEYFHRYDRSLADKNYNPTLSVYCMVESTGVSKQPAVGALVAAACDPNPGVNVTYANGVGGTICDEQLCAIPCTASNSKCNALEVAAQRDVPFYFAPAVGIKSPGTTGAVASVSCVNGCGSGGTPNPADVAIVADRTPSMTDKSFTSMQTGIEKALEIMTPEYQFVTFGTINRSKSSPTDSNCLTSQGAAVTLVGGKAPDYYPAGGARLGAWMPLGFSNNYLNGKLGDPVGTRSLIVTKSKTSLGYQVSCMDHVSSDNLVIPGTNVSTYPWGTSLAAPLKAAAQSLLLESNSNLGQLSQYRHDHLTTVQPKKWIIFETDGQPDETMGYNASPTKDRNGKVTYPGYSDENKDPGSTDILTGGEPTALSPTNDATGCQNMVDVATKAKKAGINIIMIAYGDATTAKCGSMYVKNEMAMAASSVNGVASTANNDCTKPAGAAAENADKDYFFCASTAADLETVFETVVGMTSSPNTKFVKMPK